MNIHLVRHGQSTANRDNLIQGQSDTQLTILGKQQAKLVASRLKNHKFDHIYSSDLKRAKNTANQINYHHNKKLILDKRLREINRGKWQGKNKNDVDFSKLKGTNLERKPSGGESIIEQDKRISDFINYLKDKYSGTDKNILIVSHGGSMRYLIKNIFDIKLNKANKLKKPNNCAYYHIDCTKEKPQYLIENCNKHLTFQKPKNNLKDVNKIKMIKTIKQNNNISEYKK